MQMKKNNVIFAAVFIALAMIAGCAAAQDEADFETQVMGGGVGIYGYTGKRSDVAIPEKIGGRPVTFIYEGAFYNQRVAITSVKIPGTVTEIGKIAFFQNQLTSITIPVSVTKIGGSAFFGNPLTSITIGANVELPGYAVTEAVEEFDIPSYIMNAPFDGVFEPYYIANGRKAGTYTLSGGNWSFKAR